MGVPSLVRSAFLIISLFIAGSIQAQCVLNFSGKITDSDTREQLIGASVTIRELRLTSITDAQGNFQFNGLCPGNYNLEISHIHCESIEFHLHLKEDLKKDFQLPHKANLLSEVVITGLARARVTGLTGELKGKDLEATRGLSLGESLKQVNGVSVLQTGSNIYKPVIHGLHSNRVLILNNGIRQEGQQWGSEHAPEIDPYIANRLTVIKGAASIRYGADAIGGVVLVEPKLLRYVPGVSGELNAALFSNNRQGVFSGMIEGNSSRRPSFAWRLQGTVKRGGNARTPGYWLANSGVEEYNGSATAGWRKEKSGIELFYSIFNTTLGIFRGSHIGNVTDLINAINSKEPPEYIRNESFTWKIDRPYQQVQHQLFKAKSFIQTGKSSRLNLILSGQYNRRQEFDIVRSTRSTPQLELHLFSGMGDVVWDHFGSGRWKGSMGMSALYQNNVYNYRYFVPDYQSYNLGWFVAEKYELNKWQFDMGIRYDIKKIYSIFDNDEPPFNRLTGNALVPGEAYGTRNFNGFSGNGGITYKATEDLRFSLGFASAWRAPQVNEIYSDGLHHGAARIEKGNLRLNSERANSVQGTAQYGTDHVNIDFGFYYKRIKDFIFLKPMYPPLLTIRGAFPAFQFSQTDAGLTGFDLSFWWLIEHHYRLIGKASILRARDLSADDWLIQMPADRMEAGFEYIFSDTKKWKQSYIKAGMQYVARQSRVPETGNIEIKQPDGSIKLSSDYAMPPGSYSLLNLEAGTDVYLRGKPLSIVFAVTNLLNTKYRDYMNAFRYYADDMGRNISLRIKIPFEFNRKKI